MARLVVGDQALALGEVGAGRLLEADRRAVNGVVDLVVRDLCFVVTRGDDGGLVHQVGERGAREASCAFGDDGEVTALSERLALGVHLEDREAPLDVRQIDGDAPVEAARARERAVEHIGAVGGGEHDDARVAVEAVHLSQDLIECLLALVVAAAAHAAARAARARAADRVDLVNEDDARRVLLRLTEEITHAARAHADEHLDELGARGGDEGDARLARDRARKQRLARSGRPLHNRPLGDLGTESRVLGRVLKEIDNLGELLLGAVAARNVLEGDARLRLHLDLGLRLAHTHRAARPTHRAALAARGEDVEPDEEEEGQEVDQQAAKA